MLDPSSMLTAFFELPRWAQPTLLVMAAALVLMNTVLVTALRSRRKALLRVEELTIELADAKAKLNSETRWRQADESYRARMAETTIAVPPTNAQPASAVPSR
jgi:hypothetical protein